MSDQFNQHGAPEGESPDAELSAAVNEALAPAVEELEAVEELAAEELVAAVAPADSGAASGMELTSAEVGAKLRSLSDLPVTDHVAVFEEIHSELQGALNRLDGS